MVRQYEESLFDAIVQGRLQEQLYAIESGETVTVLTGLSSRPNITPEEPDPTATGLGGGATAGIIVAAFAAIFIPVVYFMFVRRHRGNNKKKEKDKMRPYEPYDTGADIEPDSNEKDSIDKPDVYTPEDMALAPQSTLGASHPDYGKHSRKAMEAMEAGADIVAEPAMDGIHSAGDSSSAAGSSGWSSSAGISSLNTGSVDDSMDAAAMAGATLAGLGANSALARKVELDRKRAEPQPVPDVPTVSREQLDHLIETGDWAAVGATAALLAAASDSQSASSRSRTSNSRTTRDTNSIDAARAAELDHLVDAGDWEGVVLAAAKFEAAEFAGTVSAGSGRTGSSADSGASSATGTGTGTGGSRSMSETLSESPSKQQKRAETRKEVEALVRRVVPEEIDNVDEMMNQFQGREDELVETLRTMQERAIAQKARAAGHKAAKVEARRTVHRERGVVPGASAVAQRVGSVARPGDAAAGNAAASSSGPQPDATPGVASGATATAVGATLAAASRRDAGSLESSQGPSDIDSNAFPSEPSRSKKRTALEEAIEAGDWEAVGEAAAMMSDASITTASSAEIDRLAHLEASSSSRGSSSRAGRSLEGVNAVRAAELDRMIDRGDWQGVVQAAQRFSRDERRGTKQSGDDVGRTKEEQEALAQAELWMKIAEKKKAEGATDAGASDAAEWAIQRSLSQLKEAEKKKGGDSRKKQAEEDEV